MIKVYQTIHGKGNGNCMQAAFASLLELPLDDVPNFKAFGDKWFVELWNFLIKKGYEHHGTLYNKTDGLIRGHVLEKYEDRFNEIKKLEGVNGLFYAAVYSPKHYNKDDENPTTHAVIIDKDFNIVHDVNSEYKNIKKYPEADKIGYNGIVCIHMINSVSK